MDKLTKHEEDYIHIPKVFAYILGAFILFSIIMWGLTTVVDYLDTMKTPGDAPVRLAIIASLMGLTVFGVLLGKAVN
jgi:hypothetical protein